MQEKPSFLFQKTLLVRQGTGLSQFEKSVLALSESVNTVTESLATVAWAELDSARFVHQAGAVRGNLKEIAAALTNAEHYAELEGSDLAAEFREKKLELNKWVQKLSQNIDLDSRKTRSLEDVDLFPNKKPFNANFAGLQHEVRTFLLQLGYLVQKGLLEVRRVSVSPLREPSTSKTLLLLLKEKESELLDLKDSQFELRKSALAGPGFDRQVADMESELSEDLQRIKLSQQRIEQNFGRHKELNEKLFDSTLHLRNELLGLQESVSNLSEKHSELILRLKKEADASRNLAFSLEHETASLRSRYTSQILEMDQKVLAAKEGESGKVQSRMEKLENESRRNSDLAVHFKELVSQKEKRIGSLEHELIRLRLALATHTKHAMVKNAFLKSPGASSKTNKKKRRANTSK